MTDFSVSLTFISSSDENMFNNDGINKKVTKRIPYITKIVTNITK